MNEHKFTEGTQAGVFVGVFVGVLVGVFVGVLVGVLVGVSVGVFVGVLVGVFVGVLVWVLVGVFVGVSQCSALYFAGGGVMIEVGGARYESVDHSSVHRDETGREKGLSAAGSQARVAV